MSLDINKTYERKLQDQITELLNRFPENRVVYSRELSETVEKIEEFVGRALYNQYSLDSKRIERSVVMMTNPPIMDRLFMILYRIFGVYRTERSDLEGLQNRLRDQLARTPARPVIDLTPPGAPGNLITAQLGGGTNVYELGERC